MATPLDSPLALPPKGFDVDRNAPPSFLARIWLELDAIPIRVHCRDTQFSLVGEAVRAVETALEYLSPTTNSIIKSAVSQSRRQVLGTHPESYLMRNLANMTQWMGTIRSTCMTCTSRLLSPLPGSGIDSLLWRARFASTKFESRSSRPHHAGEVLR